MENTLGRSQIAIPDYSRSANPPAQWEARDFPAPALPPERAALSRCVEWAAMFFGVACLLDALREAFSFTGEPGVHPEIYVVYGVVLGGYSVAREWEKWVAPGAQDAPRYGHVFVPAWLGLAALVWLLDFIGWERRPHWPSHLTSTLANVVAFSFGTRLSGTLRRWGWGATLLGAVGRAAPARMPPTRSRRAPAPLFPVVAPPAQGPAAPPQGSPAPEPLPDDFDDCENAGQFQRTEAYWLVRETARRLGTFTPAGLAKASGIAHSIKYHINSMRREGLVVRLSKGHYKWTGGAKDETPSTHPDGDGRGGSGEAPSPQPSPAPTGEGTSPKPSPGEGKS